MSRNRYLLNVLFFVLFINCGRASIDSLNFISPVDHKIRLTGNFMEIRTNHFHSGIDIKSEKGVVGDNIKAVHEGFVSRIKIQSGSYGQSLYIDHPNGYTSVYAHLNEYIPEIENYVKDVQYEVESFAVDIYLPDSLIMLSQGQLIGKMGNTGRSFGPHLHFELRETLTEKPVNPELFGLGPEDNKNPSLESLSIYCVNEEGKIDKTLTKYLSKQDGVFGLHENLVSTNCSQVAFGIQAFDQMNGSYNKNGIYKLQMKVDDEEYFMWKAEDYSFEESKKINGFIDYNKQINLGQKVYRLFEPFCNSMNSIRSKNNGIVNFNKGKELLIEIKAEDLYSNTSKLRFKITSQDTLSPNLMKSSECDTSLSLSVGMFDVNFPAYSLFSSENIKHSSSTKIKDGQKCHLVSIGNKSLAVGKYFEISTPIPASYNKNWTFITNDKKGRWVTFGSDTINGKMYTYIDQLGDFLVYKDKKPPSLKIINLESTMKKPWKVLIEDNLIPDGMVSDLSFRATVNGQWICMNYDLKNDILIFDDFERLSSEDLDFVLEVTDPQGNRSVLQRHISR